MATITETSPAMSDASARSGVQIIFKVLDRDDASAVAVADANGRSTPNLRDRLFVTSVLMAERSDARGHTFRETDQQHVDATNYATLNTGALLSAIKIIHDVDRVREGLA